MASKTLVVGAGGQTGRLVVDGLLKADHKVVAAVHDAKKPAVDRLRKAGAEIVTFDFTDVKSVDALFGDKSVDQMYLLTPLVENLHKYSNTMVDAAKKSGHVKFIVRLSAMGADAKTHSINAGVWHGQADNHLKESGVNYCIIQSNLFIQNIFMHPIKPLATITASCSAKAATSFVDARDVADAVIGLLLNPIFHMNRVYTMTGPESVTYNDIVALFTKHVKPVKYVEVSAAARKEQLSKEKLPEWMATTVLGMEDMQKTGKCEAVDTFGKQFLDSARTYENFVKQFASVFK